MNCWRFEVSWYHFKNQWEFNQGFVIDTCELFVKIFSNYLLLAYHPSNPFGSGFEYKNHRDIAPRLTICIIKGE